MADLIMADIFIEVLNNWQLAQLDACSPASAVMLGTPSIPFFYKW